MNGPLYLPFALVAFWCLHAVSGQAQQPPATLPESTALDDYVQAEDDSYFWSIVSESKQGLLNIQVVDMVSQTWRTEQEVDRTEWQHWMVVVAPDEIETETALLFIGGGSNGGPAPKEADQRLIQLAQRNRAVVAELRQVPNQPLTFLDDGRARWEDDQIAYTWNKFMDTGDPTWPSRNPMIKSAVRAMDTIQELNDSVESFVVTGASKRGWTTWLTGALDERVVGIAPMVIDLLNLVPSFRHHHAALGFWAPAVGDYVRNGIMDRRNDPEYQDLVRLVDPYAYRHRLSLPKYLLHASGDEFFLPDSSQFYLNDLIGETLVRTLPNASHSLSGTDVATSLDTFFHAIAYDLPRPSLSSRIEQGEIHVRLDSGPRPTEAKLWTAHNDEARDFRVQTIGKSWKATPIDLPEGSEIHVPSSPPQSGWTASFVELSYEIGPGRVLKLTSQVRVEPDVLPFRGVLDPELQQNDH